MNLNLTEVILEDGRTIDTELPLELEELSDGIGTYPVKEKEPMKLEIVRTKKKVLKIRGKSAITVLIPCDRCLDDVTVPLELDFVEKVPQRAEVSPKEARRGPESEDDDISALDPDCYLDGYNLDVDKLLLGEALLNWPSRVLCREDCKGLCPVCGQNLNHGDCGCERKALDPRMAKVLDVFSKFKEV
jgi:uncharacterized protein